MIIISIKRKRIFLKKNSKQKSTMTSEQILSKSIYKYFIIICIRSRRSTLV